MTAARRVKRQREVKGGRLGAKYQEALSALKATPVIRSAPPARVRLFLETLGKSGLEITQRRAESLAVCETLAECNEMIREFRLERALEQVP